MATSGTARAEDLSSADREEVVDVLVAAFHDYPVMRYMLGREYSEGDRQLRALLGFYADKRFRRDWPVLGVRIDREVVAVCLVSVPQEKPASIPKSQEKYVHNEDDSTGESVGKSAGESTGERNRDVLPDITDLEVELKAAIGNAAYYRMNHFEAESDAMEPDEPYHFIGMLAVHPEHQKKGYAKLLVQRVEELSRKAGSAGICLTTEDARNLPIYERMGFFVVSEVDVDDVHSWCLLWANRTEAIADVNLEDGE